MDNRLLIGFSVFLALFLAFPFIAQFMREDNATEANQAAPDRARNAAPPIPSEPPLLNAQNVVGTEWQVEAEGFILRITVAPNGVLYATHPLMKSMTGLDYVEGRWRIEYDKLYVQAQLGTQYFNEVLDIRGYNLYSGSSQVKRFH